MYRLLIVTDDCSNGGTSRVAKQLALGLREDYEIHFACHYNERTRSIFEPVSDAGIVLHDYHVSERNLWKSTYDYNGAKRVLDACDPHLILSVDGAGISSLLALKAIAKERGIGYVVVVNLLEEGFAKKFSAFMDLSLQTLQHADAVVFVSEATKRQLTTSITALRHPLFLAIPNGVNERFFRAVDDEFRSRKRKSLGVADDEFLCITTARVEPRKGHSLTLSALGDLKRRGKAERIRLVLAGRGNRADIERMQSQIEHLHLDESVIFLGERDDVQELLCASDLFILPSYSEGMPLAIIEAMATGMPIVATAVDGVPELIDQSCGVLLPSPNENEAECIPALSDALLELSQDNTRLKLMGSAAKTRALGHFSERITLERYRQLLKRFEREKSVLLESKPEPADSVRLLDFSAPTEIWNYLGDGWSHSEADGIWTDGPESTFSFPIGTTCSSIRLVFDVSPFIHGPWKEQLTEVVANGCAIGVLRFNSADRRIVSFQFNLEDCPSQIDVRLLHRKSVVPTKLGVADDRELAFNFHNLEILPALPPLIPEVSIDFANPENCVAFTGWGWSHREDDGLWTDGPESFLSFPVSLTASELTLTLEVTPFIERSWEEQIAEVFANGRKLANLRFDTPGRQKVSVQVPLIDAKGHLKLHLLHKRAVVPATLGIADTRELALKLHSLTLESPPPPLVPPVPSSGDSKSGVPWILHRCVDFGGRLKQASRNALAVWIGRC